MTDAVVQKAKTAAPHRPSRVPLARVPVGLVAGAVAALLAVTSGQYGYHRDELYFRVLGHHPAWGYIDQPPATPLLIRLSITVFGDSVKGLRVPAVLSVACAAVLLALLAAELGGGRTAQVVAAAGTLGVLPLEFGHIFLTATLDMVIWLAAVLFAIRALLRDRPRWWLAMGAVVGIGLYNKLLILLLLLALGGGLLLVGPRRTLASRWLWAGLALAAVLGSPNLVYQVLNGFPELKMAAALRQNKGKEAMTLLLPFQVVATGPVAITVAGIARLLRDRSLRPLRALAVGYFLLLMALFALAGQPYYSLGLLLALYAVGSVALAERWARRPDRWRRPATGIALAVLAAVAFTLPVFPLSVQERIGLASLNQGTRDEIGWPAYVSQIAAVYRSLPPAEAAQTVIVTQNYGEYGAVARYGAAAGLPVDRLFSGQNALRDLGRPPDAAGTAVMVGFGDHRPLASRFESCSVAGLLDSGYRIDNEEQGRTIEICRTPRLPWHTLWPSFYHYD